MLIFLIRKNSNQPQIDFSTFQNIEINQRDEDDPTKVLIIFNINEAEMCVVCGVGESGVLKFPKIDITKTSFNRFTLQVKDVGMPRG